MELQTKACVSGYAYSRYGRGAEEITDWFNGPEGDTAKYCEARRAQHGTKEVMVTLCTHLSPDVSTCVLPLVTAKSGKENKVASAHLILHIVQFAEHVILIFQHTTTEYTTTHINQPPTPAPPAYPPHPTHKTQVL